MKNDSLRYSNQLIHESSPYLLQHAHNPVHWHPWNEEIIHKAKSEDKPIIISIGYSACHWCHVMERESFEDVETANIMNTNFICIKVDREERPDLDHIYMEAVQMLTGHGGWPLNVFLTPDAKPFYGGTYFPPYPAHGRPSWTQVLQSVTHAFINNRKAIEEQADKITRQIKNSFFIEKVLEINSETENNYKRSIEEYFDNSLKYFDKEHGGFGTAPKFPHFHNILFLIRYSFFSGNETAKSHALLSIDKMIEGGIYDQIGGGISRYSTDSYWLVPHFEKMLYDNALLVQTLAEAFAVTQNIIYKEKINQTVSFIEREMMSYEGGFYAALDADSENEEGKYYVWKKTEIDNVLGTESALFCEFFDITENGNWEHKNIPSQKFSYQDFSKKNNLTDGYLKEKIKNCSDKLLNERLKRTAPGLDDKILLNWNAMMCIALVKAFRSTAVAGFKNMAVRNIDFLLNKFIVHVNGKNLIYHTYKNNKATQPAFLDDVALLIQACIEVYQITFEPKYLIQAKQLTDYVIEEFYNNKECAFNFSGKNQKDVILKKPELTDGVTPSGNSVMIHNLYILSVIYNDNEYRKITEQILPGIINAIEKYPLSFANWALYALQYLYPVKEIVIVGKKFKEFADKIIYLYRPHSIIIASENPDSDYPVFNGKISDHKTRIYLCQNNTCFETLESTENISFKI
jgi:uncharacterized protein